MRATFGRYCIRALFFCFFGVSGIDTDWTLTLFRFVFFGQTVDGKCENIYAVQWSRLLWRRMKLELL